LERELAYLVVLMGGRQMAGKEGKQNHWIVSVGLQG
jgi:hypothetical protein